MKITKAAFIVPMLIIFSLLAGMVAMQDVGAIDPPRPDNPASYLAFAESLGEDSETTAIQSAFLGAKLAQKNNDPVLAATCIIFAASIVQPNERTELWDLAVMLDPSRIDAWQAHRSTENPLLEQAAQTILFARYNQHEQPDSLGAHRRAVRLIADAGEGLGYRRAQITQALAGLASHAEQDSCNGRIFIPQRNRETNKIERVLCPQHARPVGALGSDDEFVMLLRTELALRAISTDSWGLEQGASSIALLQDPTIEQWMILYEISTRKPYWSNGGWSSSP